MKLLKASLPYLLALCIGSYFGYKYEHSDYIQASNALAEYKASSVTTSLEGKILVLETTKKLAEEVAKKEGQLNDLQLQLTNKENEYAIERKKWMVAHPLPASCVFDVDRMRFIAEATRAVNSSIASYPTRATK